MWTSKVQIVSAVGRTKQQEALLLTSIWLTFSRPLPPHSGKPKIVQIGKKIALTFSCLQRRLWGGYIYTDRCNCHGSLQCRAQKKLKVGQYKGRSLRLELVVTHQLATWAEPICLCLSVSFTVQDTIHFLAGSQVQSCYILSPFHKRFPLQLSTLLL